MVKIIFTIKETGHNLEYIHNIYEQCLQIPDVNFVFLVPEKMKCFFKNFAWEESEHIVFDYISAKEQAHCLSYGKLRNSFNTSIFLRKKVLEHNAKEVFLITMMTIMPFGGIIIPAKISGIIYGIYLYNWKYMSKMGKALNIIKYTFLSRIRRFKNVLILNDKTSVHFFNRKYRTNKFVYLSDPFVPIETNDEIDFRSKYNIPNNLTVFVHFGAIERRKGTLDILSSILCLPEDIINKCFFVFAGKVKTDIKDMFYQKAAMIDKRRILIIDKFCSYDLLASMCLSCNAILMPYLEFDKSSGLLGYSSQFSKPVIGSSFGLISKLIKRYKLGIVCLPGNPQSLINCYREVIEERVDTPTNRYCQENTVASFKKIIDSVIK